MKNPKQTIIWTIIIFISVTLLTMSHRAEVDGLNQYGFPFRFYIFGYCETKLCSNLGFKPFNLLADIGIVGLIVVLAQTDNRSTMQTTGKEILIHLGLASAFAISTLALTDLIGFIFPDIGYHFLTVFYILIISAQILFYYVTTYTNVWLTILSFILNYILTTAEQVNIESKFQDTPFYQSGDFRYGIIILCGLLWGTNKFLLDRLFIYLKAKTRLTNRVDNLLARLTTK